MKSGFLHQFARLLIGSSVPAGLHPLHLGYLRRDDGWQRAGWTREPSYHVFYFVEHGEIALRWGRESAAIGPGEGVCTPGAAHPDIRWSIPIELREVWVETPGWVPGAGSEIPILRFRTPPEIPSLVDNLTAEQIVRDPGSPSFRPRLALIAALCAQARDAFETETRTLTANQRIRLVRWVREHLGEPLSPAKLAAVVGLTPDYFARVFRNSFGQSPRDWLVAERVHAARHLIDESGVPAAEAMTRFGFRDLSHFSRQMKRVTGLTPGGKRGWRHR